MDSRRDLMRNAMDDAMYTQDPLEDVVSIVVTPATPTVVTTQQMIATATMRDGSTRVITTLAVWASSDPTKGTVAQTGIVTGVLDGTTTISATWNGEVGSTVATINVP